MAAPELPPDPHPPPLQGCAWIGLSNLAATAVGNDASQTTIQSLSFLDGTPTTEFLTDIRTSPALAMEGWPYYGQAAAGGSIAQSGEKYATCSMVCTSWPNPGLSTFATMQTYFADCSSIVLPYICELGDVARTTMFTSPDPGTNASESTPAAAHGRRQLKAPALSTSASASALAPELPPSRRSLRQLEVTSELAAQAKALSLSVERVHRHSQHAAAASSSSRRRLRGGSAEVVTTWPVEPVLVPTVAGNASCYPFGVNILCTFPSTVKLTQVWTKAQAWTSLPSATGLGRRICTFPPCCTQNPLPAPAPACPSFPCIA